MIHTGMVGFIERRSAHYRVGAVALAVFGCAALGVNIGIRASAAPFSQIPGLVLSLVASAALLLVSRFPRTATLVATCCVTAECVLGYLPTPLLLAPVIGALYWLAVVDSTKVVALWTVGAVAAISEGWDDPTPQSLLLRTVGVWLLAAVFAGRMTREHRSYLGVVQARAEDAERGRDDEARRRVTEERVRIARDLHDVVAHHLAVANAQAQTAAHIMGSRPDQARELLAGLSGSTAAALRELKATVTVLRNREDERAAGMSGIAPAPGLQQLQELVEACRMAGVDVTVTSSGSPELLPRMVDLTAFRIIQEALTNVTKHAVDPAVTITLGCDERMFRAGVVNTGARGSPAGTGYGLIGMRERALAVGGSVQTGPAGPDEYAVTFTVPLATWRQAEVPQ